MFANQPASPMHQMPMQSMFSSPSQLMNQPVFDQPAWGMGMMSEALVVSHLPVLRAAACSATWCSSPPCNMHQVRGTVDGSDKRSPCDEPQAESF